jgi:hypothetical protein
VSVSRRIRVDPRSAPYGIPGMLVAFDGGPLAGTDVPSMTGSLGTTVEPAQAGALQLFATNIGGAPTSGAYTLEVDLPAGVTTNSTPDGLADWVCTPGASQSSFSCASSKAVDPGATARAVIAPLAVTATAEGTLTAEVSISGGGAGSGATFELPIVIDDTPAEAGVQAFYAGAYDENGVPETRAGAHPFSASTGFLLNTVYNSMGQLSPAGDLKDVLLDPPVGFVGNPLVAPRCPRGVIETCTDDAVIGTVKPTLEAFGNSGGDTGLRNVLPPSGSAAQFTFIYSAGTIATAAQLRPNDYGVRTITPNIISDYRGFGAFVTLWGQPGHPAHDSLRCGFFTAVGCPDPKPGTVDEAFLTNPTECTGNTLETMIRVSAWQSPSIFDGMSDVSPVTTDCEDVPFDPVVELAATSGVADAASGLDFDLELPQDGLLDPDGIATSHLRDVVVDLPEGLTVNPSGATGLEGCSNAQMAPGTDSAPQCPNGSKIGSVEITSPLVDHPVAGAMYLGSPRSIDPQSGEMFRLWVVARDDELGVMIKVPGSATANPQTGELRATFRNNPRLPFDHISVKLKGGDRGLLAMPQTCGVRSIGTELSPWSGTAPVSARSPFGTSAGCGFGFSPSIEAGGANTAARGTGEFSFDLTRPQGDQWVHGVSVDLPHGFLASVRDVPLCPTALAASGSCPESSRIGTVDASAGSGSPFVLEEKGAAYLTEGYRGAPYGMVVKVRAIAGPFRGDMELSPIIVRQAIHVDRDTAQVSVVSDPIPTVWHGVPLRVRRLLVNVDRPAFTLNPSDCSAKQVGAQITSVEGATANLSEPFRVSGCAGLRFRPRLSLRLTGRRQVADGKHPGVRAVVRQAPGEAGMRRVVTRLPLSLALDPYRAQSDDLCEFDEARKKDPNCPARSIIGRARAFSPLLNKPLEGPVYFAKNVRFHPKTGNPIRTLPTLVTELSGEIDLVVRATTDTQRGKLVTTFPSIPDAPVDRFELNLEGGKEGILTVTNTNLCRRPRSHITEVDTDGHNGRRHDFDVRIKTPCAKKKRAKRQSRLRIGRVSWSGRTVRVSGRVSHAATRDVRVTIRCGQARTSRRADPNRAGMWNTALRVGRRCAETGRARLVARYPGGPKLRPQTRARAVSNQRETAAGALDAASAAVVRARVIAW